MTQCPRCASEISSNEKVCPRCGLPVSKMEELDDSLVADLERQSKDKKLNIAQRQEKKRLAKQKKKEAKRQKKLEQQVSTTDFSKFASNANSNNGVSVKKKRRKKDDEFKFEVDENGQFNIDTTDVEIIGEEVSRAYDERREKQSYSIKKARGDYRPPKIKWWEIYKLADRSFARRKIKKEISKAGKVKPDFISKAKLLLLAIFFGWFGAHNFYAKNKKKGFVSLTFLTISILGMALNEVPFFKMFELWIIGFSGFVVLFIWVTDVVNIIFNKFQYRIQRDKFIAGLNIETRAKLGEKYIDLELLHRPWWVRFKVWCEKKKRNYYEWRQERRQALIQKEKAKLEQKEQKQKIDEEIAKAEEKELEKITNEKAEKKKASTEEKIMDVGEKEDKKIPQKKKAKISVKTNSKTKTTKKK